MKKSDYLIVLIVAVAAGLLVWFFYQPSSRSTAKSEMMSIAKAVDAFNQYYGHYPAWPDSGAIPDSLESIPNYPFKIPQDSIYTIYAGKGDYFFGTIPIYCIYASGNVDNDSTRDVLVVSANTDRHKYQVLRDDLRQ